MTIHLLQAMPQHRAVNLFHQFAVDSDEVIAGYAKQIRVVSSVMDFAQTEPVLDERKPMRLVVTNDVSRIQKSAVLQSTDGASSTVGEHDSTAKLRLVQSLLCRALGIDPLNWCQVQRIRHLAEALVERDHKPAVLEIIEDDIDREDGHVHAGSDSTEQDNGQPELACSPQF